MSGKRQPENLLRPLPFLVLTIQKRGKDLFDPAVYKAPIEKKYRIKLTIPKFRGKKKWSERVKDVFKAHGCPWDDSIEKEIKYIVANQVSLNPLQSVNAKDKLVIMSLIGALESRLKEREKAQQDASVDS